MGAAAVKGVHAGAKKVGVAAWQMNRLCHVLIVFVALESISSKSCNRLRTQKK